MAELIAVGATETPSAEFVLADGAATIVLLKPASGATLALPSDAAADIQMKTSDSGWVGMLPKLTITEPARRVYGPGTFRVVRRAVASPGSYGVDRTP